MRPLEGKIAVVAGATRGAGRGIACMLGEAGATVYCTGRSSRKNKRRPKRTRKQASPFELERRAETIEETAELVAEYGGTGIAVRVDHTDERQVKALFQRVKRKHGRIDILINDVWGGDALAEWGVPFWKMSMEKGLAMIERAVFSHIITARHGLALMVPNGSGLIVEITDGDQASYRGTFFYDLVKMSVIRIAFALAEELREHNIAAVAVSPGFLRSEAMLEHFGVTEENWRDGVKKDSNFIESETPFYVGRAVAALAADPKVMEKSGRVFGTWSLQPEYGFTDVDGRRPSFPKHLESVTDEHTIGIREEMKRSHERFISAFRES